MDPDTDSMASGRSVLRMKFPPATPAGQGCHCTSCGESVWPMPMSPLATRISVVSSLAFCSGGGAGGFSERPASRAATPPAARATPNTTIRAAFITHHFLRNMTTGRPPAHHMAADAADRSGFQQLKVKVWLRTGIQIELMFCCSTDKRDWTRVESIQAPNTFIH